MNPRLESCAMVASSQPIPKLPRPRAPLTNEQIVEDLFNQLQQCKHEIAILRSQVKATTNLHPAMGLV
jgi:hypothetical protein